MKKAEIGVFGGSGFYSFLDKVEEVEVSTPFGKPSDKIALAQLKGKKVAFLPRHGKKHKIPPHSINYRANVWAMKELGVSRIVSPSACGSLQREVKRGDFVICDQFIDRTKGRADTFYDGPEVVHIMGADPYCPELRKIAVAAAKELKIPVHEKGTVVVIQGPRFSTRSESRWFSSQGWEVINMTQYPEVVLAREADLCYVSISLITDYDVGLEGEVEPVSIQEVLETLRKNNEKVKNLLFHMIEKIPSARSCTCGETLKNSKL